MHYSEAVLRERGSFGPLALACVQAALSHLPSADCLTTAPLFAVTPTLHDILDMVDAESFLLCFYEECSAILKVQRNLQRLALRSCPSSTEDYRKIGLGSTAPSTGDVHSCAVKQLNSYSNKDYSHRTRARDWNLHPENIQTAISCLNVGHQAVTRITSEGNLEGEVSHFFHTLMQLDPRRAGTVSVPNFRRAALCMLLEPCRMLPSSISSSDNTFLFVEAVKKCFMCGGKGDMINYVRLWATALSYLEETQGTSLGLHKECTITAVERGMTIVSSTNA